MKKTTQLTWQLLFAFSLAGLLIWFMFRDVPFSEFRKALTEVQAEWLIVMLVPILGSFVTRVFRWGYIVRTAGPVTFRDMFSATQIGFLVNFTVPFRLGEVVRAVALTRLSKIPLTKSIAFSALDRVADLFGLIVVVAIAVRSLKIYDIPEFNLPASVSRLGSDIPVSVALIRKVAFQTELALGGLVALLVLMYLKQDLVIRVMRWMAGLVSKRLAERAVGALNGFAAGLHIFRSAGDMLKCVAWSLATWAFFVMGIYCLMRAFAFEGPWYAVFVMQALLALAVSLPLTPGLIGQFQIPIIITLLWLTPNVSAPQALAASFVCYAINLILIIATGIVCVCIERRRLFAFGWFTAKPQPDSSPG
ncbi:MAG TPA: lysylphosphatidylglycerol synthase transmembrane domain-containing protein [Candidatus Hydrogenedentes bacterium]|nr:lysylphosphatidylglycerol synthase transmembrane domain-containing protein [Candidatus Hydrogenedentota bacterium]